MEKINKIGRRKEAVARVYMSKGTGEVIINNKPLATYFTIDNIRLKVLEPFMTLDLLKEYDVKVNVVGGGYKGQAEAIRMAISRALVEISEDYRSPLKEKKFLTRDSREVERKKYGKPKARKSFQFSKR